MLTFRNMLTAIVILFLFTAVLAGLYLIFGEMDAANRAKLFLETAKSLLQLGVIVILGGLAASMLKSFEKERINSKAIHDFHMEFLTELRDNYELVEKSRRSLRASGLTDTEPPITLSDYQVKDYQKYMLSLDKSQLRLERLKLELGNFPDAFKEFGELATQISSMEEYIRCIHKEYEKNWSKLRGDPTQVKFEDLGALREFTGNCEDSKFEAKFAKPYDKALGLIRQELLPFKVAKSNYHQT